MEYLRDYQTETMNAVTRELNHVQSTLFVMPTGTGKTETFLSIADQWPQGKVLVIAHREELIWQPFHRWKDRTGDYGEVEMADYRGRTGHRRGKLTFASKDSLHPKRLAQAFPDPNEIGLLIIDEAHHAVRQNKTYQRIIDYFSQNKDFRMVGCTATPDRTDEAALGQTFDSVAYEYPLLDPRGGPSAIRDGWLVPIKSQLIVVDEINFSELDEKMTGGDFQVGMLDHEMKREEVLHKIAEPTVELSGTGQTLCFLPGVDSGCRFAEILMRKPETGRAFCLVSRVPSEARYDFVIDSRDKKKRAQGLKRFESGWYQYGVNCAVLTEGYDNPQIRTLCMGRPCRSRSLAAQMAGRGTRVLPGVIEGKDEHGDWWRVGSPEKRREAIAASGKPYIQILDFVGNSRHKLMTSTDVLGGKYPDEVVERAKKIAAETSESSGDVQMDLEKAQEQLDSERRQREKIQATVKYSSREVDVFGVLDVVPVREPGWHKGRQPTARQVQALLKFRVEDHKIERMSFHQASQALDSLIKRSERKFCTYRQAKILKKHGVETKALTFEAAGGLITRLKNNGWRNL